MIVAPLALLGLLALSPFVSPARAAEEWGWQVEPDPPEFVRDPNWVSELKREPAGNEQEAEPDSVLSRGPF